jgi:hypothetical protein
MLLFYTLMHQVLADVDARGLGTRTVAATPTRSTHPTLERAPGKEDCYQRRSMASQLVCCVCQAWHGLTPHACFKFWRRLWPR